MWRTTMSDGPALLSPELDARDRAAAIAAMAARLAAGQARMRARAAAIRKEPTLPGAMADSGDMGIRDPDLVAERGEATAAEALPARAALPADSAAAPLDFARERLAPVSAPPPAPWRQHLGTARNVALLAAMAGSGFGAVMLAQSPTVTAYFSAGHAAAPIAPPAVQREAALPAAPPAANPPAPVRHINHMVQQPAATARKATHDRLAATEVAEPARAAAHRTIPRTAALDAPRNTPRAAQGAATLASRSSTPRASTRQPAEQAAYELPRWITQPPAAVPQAVAAPQPRIMSPPPQNLTLPQTPSAAPDAGTPNTATVGPRPKPSPAMVFASSYPPPPQSGWGQARPPFAPPYGPSYGSHGWYGYTPP